MTRFIIMILSKWECFDSDEEPKLFRNFVVSETA